MILHSKHYPGPGAPIVILHGLYGNQSNWAPQARLLAQNYDVYVLDARNHGVSPWADSMRLAEMADDVAETMDSLGVPSAHLIGHSMGGKTAMLLALSQPRRVQSLCVVDIAPISYSRTTDKVLAALSSLDIGSLNSRAEADTRLSEAIPQKSVRDFLLTNLQRSEEGAWRWRFNLAVLVKFFYEIIAWPEVKGRYHGPVLFIKGELSDYIVVESQSAILALFPKAQSKTVTGAGHWVHSERMDVVISLIKNFLMQLA